MMKITMIKDILNDSKKYILEHSKFVNLSFITGFSRFFYITFFLAYNVNSLLTYKLEKGLSIGTLFQYFFDLIKGKNILGIIIIILILFAIGYTILYPIGIAANINFLQGENDSIGLALGKGIKDFFSVFELNALFFSFSPYTYFTTIFKLYILDVLNNGIIIGLVIIRGTCVLFASIFRQYSKYILILKKDKDGKDIGIFEAIRKSMGLTLSNFEITIRGFLGKIRATILFYFKITIIVTVPLLIIYFLIASDNITENNQRIIWILGGLTMIITTFLLTSTQAFFYKYRNTIFHKIEK